MKIRHLHWLIGCILLIGCLPTSQLGQHPGRVRQQVNSSGPKRSPDRPKLKRLANGHYRVVKPWTVVVGNRRWQVPAGYKSNGITAPAHIKKSLGDGVEHPETWAAVFHDWLFTQKGISRTQADNLFHELLIAYGVPSSKASIMYSCVSAYSMMKSSQ